MGMCASQGRLLILTAGKSDSELQAQKINNDRENLSRQEEALMTKYSDKTGNRQLKIRVQKKDGSGTASTRDTVVLTAKLFFEGEVDDTTSMGGKYKLLLADGTPIDSLDGFETRFGRGTGNGAGEDKNVLQYLLISGGASIVNGDNDPVSAAGDTNFVESYYDSDDGEAKAEYDLEMGKIQRKDKKLELTLDQIETKHKAYETEIESVQKVINTNVEKSFNAFNS